jgi:hypothetical protein
MDLPAPAGVFQELDEVGQFLAGDLFVEAGGHEGLMGEEKSERLEDSQFASRLFLLVFSFLPSRFSTPWLSDQAYGAMARA